MEETNGMESIMWFKTERKNEKGEVIRNSIFHIYSYSCITRLDKNKVEKVYALKSDSSSFKSIDCIELDQAVIVDEKEGNLMFSGLALYNCDIRMKKGDESNPIYYREPRDKSRPVGEYNLKESEDGKLAVTSPIIYAEVTNREKVQEMIDDGVLVFPDNKCIQFKIEPFRSPVKYAA